ncbi:MAG TPA: prolyl oligopeptidase family serine peptidase [Puia sp.]|jgi:prolyl oligopeptidase
MRNNLLLPTMTLPGLVFLLFCMPACKQPEAYPVTKKVNQVDDYFGTKVSDPYRWLENDTSAETRQWELAQQTYTENYLSKISFRPAIMKRLKEVYNYPRYRNAFKIGDYIFYAHNDGLQNQSVYFYQKGLDGTPQVLIDPNQLSKDGTVSVAVDGGSNDKKYFAYHINRNGSDWSTEYFIEIATGRQLPDSISWMRDGGVAWSKAGFYYTRYPEPAKGTELTVTADHPKVYYHVLGQPQSADKFIYEDAAHPKMGLYLQTLEDEKHLFLFEVPGSTGFQVMIKDLKKEGSPFTLLFKGYDYQYNILDEDGKDILVNTNDGADNFRIVRVDPTHPDKAGWKEIVPEQKEKLESVSTAGGKIFAQYLKDANSKILQFTYNGLLEQAVALPSVGSASVSGGYKDDTCVFYGFTSFTYAPGIFRYDPRTGKSVPFKSSEVKVDVSKYESEQAFYTSKDGTKVPMFLVHKKGIALDGSHPTLLYAYGGFDISITPYFDPSVYLLLENGGVFALPNIRGGGEYGEVWHKAGMLSKKQNVFDDFIAAGEWLIAKGYTSKEKLAIEGGSNGGLLIGAVMTQRPDLCKVAFPEVGVMDMLRFQKFTSGVFWVTEYGSSDSAGQFPALYKYSPLHNIKDNTEYPATMVLTADHDDRVVPMHSFKFAATLQEKQKGPNPVLIRISINQGHGASGSSLQKGLESIADTYSFMFYNMGIKPY